jgi:hypothetical protein
VLLRELHVDAYAHLSDVLPLGLEQRLGLLADALKAFIAEPSTAQLQAIERAADSVARHAHADPASTRMLRVKMAVRLCRWMMADRPESKGRAAVRQQRSLTSRSCMPAKAPSSIGRVSS